MELEVYLEFIAILWSFGPWEYRDFPSDEINHRIVQV
jgi:hypothetical protein